MQFVPERFIGGTIRLAPHEFLVSSRTLRHDDRPIPLYDLFGAPLWIGRMKCDSKEVSYLEKQREAQLLEAEEALTGGGFSMVSNVQRFMKRKLEPMLFYTDNAILNPGNTTVIFRANIKPDPFVTQMEALVAYPFPVRNALSKIVLYRPRNYSSGRSLPGFSPSENEGQRILEVTGFQIGRDGLAGNALKCLTYPKFRNRYVQATKSVIG